MCLLTPCPPAWPVQALLDCGYPALSPPEDLVHARDAKGNLLLHELLAHCHYGPQFDTDEAGIHFDPLLQVGRLLTLPSYEIMTSVPLSMCHGCLGLLRVRTPVL
jgi:hypothetical protein